MSENSSITKEKKKLTYEDIVDRVRQTYENADARAIWNHVAVQVNVTGEGAGAFYIEVADRFVSVEPYDYYDRDGLITASGPTIMAIANGDTTYEEELKKGTLRLDGNMEAFRELRKIKFPTVKAKVTKTKTCKGKSTEKVTKK